MKLYEREVQFKYLVVEGGETRENEDQVQIKDKQNYLDLKSYWRPLTVSFLSIVVTSIFCFFLRPFLEAINIPMIFIIPIVFSGLIAGRKGGILASIMAVAFFDFFFVPPYFTFSVADLTFHTHLYCTIYSGYHHQFPSRHCKKTG